MFKFSLKKRIKSAGWGAFMFFALPILPFRKKNYAGTGLGPGIALLLSIAYTVLEVIISIILLPFIGFYAIPTVVVSFTIIGGIIGFLTPE